MSKEPVPERETPMNIEAVKAKICEFFSLVVNNSTIPPACEKIVQDAFGKLIAEIGLMATTRTTSACGNPERFACRKC